MRQVGYLQELYRDARSAKHKTFILLTVPPAISNFSHNLLPPILLNVVNDGKNSMKIFEFKFVICPRPYQDCGNKDDYSQGS